MSVHDRKPHIYKDPSDGMWVCEIEIYDRWDQAVAPTPKETAMYYAYGEGRTAAESYNAWLLSYERAKESYGVHS